MARRFLLNCSCLAFAVLGLAPVSYAQRDDYDEQPINYTTTPANDPIALLASRLDVDGEELPFDDRQGYLPAVLKALEIPVSSQTLVFSQTSMQRTRISAPRPRAIYFNDDVYVGYCQYGNVLELATTDPKLGAVFYTLEQSPADRPQFVRDRGQCLTCHASSRTQDVPGYLIRSVFANASGMPEFGSGTFTTDHKSPLDERWGGWYVTGTHGDMRHMGNAFFRTSESDLDRESHANLTSLSELVSTDPYPTPHSDIVALMVLEHQTQMHNALAWANYETRRAVHQSEIMNKAFDRPSEFLSESSDRRINSAAARVLEYLLMCGEFPLTSPVEGTSGFTMEFQSRGLRDADGRSLRDFDLTTRMFRFPCSYMIYSNAFDGLPDIVRLRVLTELNGILDGNLDDDHAERYAHLSEVDRQNIKQILLATKPEFKALAEEGPQ